MGNYKMPALHSFGKDRNGPVTQKDDDPTNTFNIESASQYIENVIAEGRGLIKTELPDGILDGTHEAFTKMMDMMLSAAKEVTTGFIKRVDKAKEEERHSNALRNTDGADDSNGG